MQDEDQKLHKLDLFRQQSVKAASSVLPVRINDVLVTRNSIGLANEARNKRSSGFINAKAMHRKTSFMRERQINELREIIAQIQT